MPQVYRLNYQPDLDWNWAVNPGLCTAMSGFVPLQNGNLSTILDVGNLSFNTTGADVIHAQMFMQTTGSVRLLAFRATNIDEYDSSGTRTNRATGLTTSTRWEAAAWGNQIIAVSKAVATQSSTGAGFTALGGSSPKAACIASNVNFTMMADVDDGGSNVYTDMVWWSAIRNPASWAPSLATQAGNIRLLDTPGPILQLWAYGDKFLAFKANSIYIGQYVGPPYVFSWRVVSNSIGAAYGKCVTECDGKVFFVHQSGFYMFDGQGLTNIGQGLTSQVAQFVDGTPTAVSDERQGIVYFFGFAKTVGGGTFYDLYPYCYNVRTGLWGVIGQVLTQTTGTGSPQSVVRSTHSERNVFHSGSATGFTYFSNGTTPKYVATVYPNATPTGTASFTTGYIGYNDIAQTEVKAYLRFVRGDGTAVSSASVSGYNDELISSGTPDGSHTMTWNTEMQTLDGRAQYRYKRMVVSFSAAIVELAGMGIDYAGSAKR